MHKGSTIERALKRPALAVWLFVLALLLPSLAVADGIDEPFKKPETAESWSWGQLFSWATGQDDFRSGKSYALVIGISAYSNGITPLQYTRNDPIRMRDFLLDEEGFDYVHVLTEEKATFRRIRQLMEDELPALIGENDRFLFYWSGHGIDFRDGTGRARGYLPLATSGPSQRSSMVSMAQLDAWDDFIHARHALYLLDACASGLASYEVQGEEDFEGLDNATLERLSKPGRHLITAGTGEQKTIASARWDGSVFTDSILRAARGEADAGTAADPADGVVSLPELLEYVTKRVDRERRVAEFETAITPKWENLRDDNEGGFFFITKDKKTETARAEGVQPTGELKDGRPLVVEVQGEPIEPGGCDVETDRLLWDTIRNETEPAYFEEYLRRAEAGEICGRFVEIARLKVEAAAGPPPEPSRTEVEQDPRRVKETQELLTALGYEPGPADGIMGGRTRKALVLFQNSTALEPTGRLTVDVEIAIAKAHAELVDSSNAAVQSSAPKDESETSTIAPKKDLSATKPAEVIDLKQNIRWKMHRAFGSNVALLGDLGTSVPEEIERRTNGRFAVEHFEPGTIVGGYEYLDALSAGTLDAAFGSSNGHVERNPAFGLLNTIPFADPDRMHRWILSSEWQGLADEMYSKWNTKSLPCGFIGSEGAGWFRRVIRTPADLQGLKMRFFGLGARTIQRLGVSTFEIAAGDIFPALETGAIDAAEFSTPYIDIDYGFYQIAKNYYYPSWHQPFLFFELAINLNRWNDIGIEAQNLIIDICKKNIEYGRQEDRKRIPVALNELRSNGVTVRELPRSIWMAAEAVWGELIEEEMTANSSLRKIYQSYSRHE